MGVRGICCDPSVAKQQPSRQPPHPRTYYSPHNEPPNDRVRVEMFLDSCQQYGNLQRAFPLPDLPIQYEGPITDRFYWIVIMHASELRKFFSKGEQVELHSVLDSARRRVRDRADRGRVVANLDEAERFARSDRVPSRMGVGVWPNGAETPVWERVIIELYGRHLHVDFGKWHAASRFIDRANTVAVYEWCLAATESVRAVELSIRDGAACGELNLEDDHQPYFLENGDLNRS